MSKLFTLSMTLFLIAASVTGCGKKEAATESMEMTMPMSVSVEDAPSTNITTRSSAPVETGASIMAATEPAATEPAASAETYAAQSAQDIQQALKNAGLYKGAIDGKIGPGTRRAITEFQQQNGLTADGKVGKKTWEKLKIHLNQQ